jgi:hypothetical protein
MTRSISKGPYVDPRVLKKVLGKRPEDTGVIKTWIRRSDISPEMVGFTCHRRHGRAQAWRIFSYTQVPPPRWKDAEGNRPKEEGI